MSERICAEWSKKKIQLLRVAKKEKKRMRGSYFDLCKLEGFALVFFWILFFLRRFLGN